MMTAAASARLEDLGQIEQAVWRELGRAVRDKSHAWRIGVLATRTIGPEPEADARSIVLRECEAVHRQLVFFADARSPKAGQITAWPAGVIVLWSPGLSWQVRLSVTLELASAGLKVSSRWARLKMTPGAQDYLSPLPPGTAIAAPSPAPSHATVARDYFSIITAQVLSLDWLELHEQGHRRARFDGGQGTWLQP